jgi:hypothetical protein
VFRVLQDTHIAKQSTADLNRTRMQQRPVTKFQEPEIYRLWKEIPTTELYTKALHAYLFGILVVQSKLQSKLPDRQAST